MTSSELFFIKNLQKIFYKKYNKELIVDFARMAGRENFETTLKRNDAMSETDLKELVEKHNFDLEGFKNRKLKTYKEEKFTKFLSDFAVTVMMNGTLSYKKCAQQLNRNRTVIYYYQDLKTNRMLRKSYYVRKNAKLLNN
ncbi:MAG: hypothetical protein ABIP51_18130 [Bacteroidia bacterium]